MILLANHSVTKVRKIPIESHSLTLTERSSTASIVPADMTGIDVGSWMMDDTNPGSGIVWRAISVSTAYYTETPTIQLEHIINTLRDRIMFGEHKAGTAVEAINMILYNVLRTTWTIKRNNRQATSHSLNKNHTKTFKT